MILPGHLAAAYLAGRTTKTDLRGVMAASMFPDLVDKPVRWLLGITPNDRIPAHTGWFWLGTSLLARWLGGSRFGQGWVVGYGAHLLCDEVNARLNPGRIYFWWPVKRYDLHVGPTGLSSSLADFSPASRWLEGGLTVIGLLVALGSRRQCNRGAQGAR